MSMDPMSAKEPDRAHYEEQDRRTPLTEYPEEPERDVGAGKEAGTPKEDADYDAGYGSATNGAANGALGGAENEIVIAPEQNTDFHARWREIQAEFIDDPRRAATDADHLVAEITKAFADQAEEERNRLASSWQQEGANGTEELRLVMRRYRGLIDHMLDQ